jgi:hypothetical protein
VTCLQQPAYRSSENAFRIQRQPFLKPPLGVGLDRVDRALRLAHPAIDAFVRVDDKHVLALVEAVHGAHFDAVHNFAANAALVNDIGQLSALSAGRSGELDVPLLRYAQSWQTPKCRCAPLAGAMDREAMLREVGQYAVAVVGLGAAVNFGLVTVLADYDPTLIKIVAVAAAAVPAALVAWFVSTRVLHIGAPG